MSPSYPARAVFVGLPDNTYETTVVFTNLVTFEGRAVSMVAAADPETSSRVEPRGIPLFLRGHPMARGLPQPGKETLFHVCSVGGGVDVGAALPGWVAMAPRS